MVGMVSGLLATFNNGSNLKLENASPKEKFEGLQLRNKYGFDLGWYTLWEKINVILKCVDGGETQIYLADNEIEGGSILGEIVKKAMDDFSVDEKDQKKVFNILKKHNCCYF